MTLQVYRKKELNVGLEGDGRVRKVGLEGYAGVRNVGL